MGTLGGIAIVVFIAMIAGVIAYIGDRVGHQVGRKRLTMFNLRPKYTSTIVAVATGMMIALVVTVTALLASAYARAAFFHLDEINKRVNQLQAEADALNKRVRETNVVINRGDLLYDQYLLLTAQMSPAERLSATSVFFDAVVQSLNRRYVPLGLKVYAKRSNSPEIRRTIQDNLLNDPRTQGALLNPGRLIVLVVADQNLFVNDPIHFGFEPYPDILIFRKDQPIGSIEVDAGQRLVPEIAYTQLSGAAQDAAIALGMPTQFARALPTLTDTEIRETSDSIRTGKGRFYIQVRAEQDIYPDTGGIPVDFVLSRTPK